MLERGGLNLPNHNDPKIDAMFDQWRRALDPQEQRTIAEEIQRYVADTAVQGYTYMRGLLVIFERTWLDRP